jgi:hypothetical protein
MGGIRDSRGPVEGAEEGHERSSIVSEGASSDGVHLRVGARLVTRRSVKSYLECEGNVGVRRVADMSIQRFRRREVLAELRTLRARRQHPRHDQLP